MMISGGSGRVRLDPTWYEASFGFVKLGVEHILSGIDHMLFLLCLVIPFRRVRPLIPVITAFTLGHSITLIGTAYNLAPVGAWFPPFVEAAIAASIFYMAIENIVGANLRRRWIIAALFGLVHGFGFADILKEQLQFAGSYLLVSLVSFNIGIEIGQLAVLCVFIPALALLVPGRDVGADGDHRAVGDRRQHRLAMDDRTRRNILADSMAAIDRGGIDGPGALDSGLGPGGGRGQFPLEMGRPQTAAAGCAGHHPGRGVSGLARSRAPAVLDQAGHLPHLEESRRG